MLKSATNTDESKAVGNSELVNLYISKLEKKTTKSICNHDSGSNVCEFTFEHGDL